MKLPEEVKSCTCMGSGNSRSVTALKWSSAGFGAPKYFVLSGSSGGEMAKDSLGRALAANQLTVPCAALSNNMLPSVL